MDKILYKELSSLEKDLGIDAKQLYTVSNSIGKHYHYVSIPKKNGGERHLSVPDNELKFIQRRINDVLLCDMPVSPYASAYRFGTSTLKNASVHINKDWVVKLDISHFFDSISYSSVKDKAFPADIYSEKNRILLSLLCYKGDSLPQGAPTSPAISNIIMYDFDMCVGKWCRTNGITYTRYCDDMTFSGYGEMSDITAFVSEELKKEHLFLNNRKTVIAHRGQKQEVTGIIVNDKPNISSDYKRKIRQEVYFIEKFGIEEHLKTIGSEVAPVEYLRSLLGRINYVLYITDNDSNMMKYKKIIDDLLMRNS